MCGITWSAAEVQSRCSYYPYDLWFCDSKLSGVEHCKVILWERCSEYVYLPTLYFTVYSKVNGCGGFEFVSGRVSSKKTPMNERIDVRL